MLKVDLEKIPNKEDFLMTCKYLTLAYFKEFQKNSKFLWIGKAEKVNHIAISTWESIHLYFDGINTNQNLAIYSLVPFSETITIEMLRKELGLDYSLDKIFSSSQKLKYYDLLKYGRHENDAPSKLNILELQKKLRSGEIFLDFHISFNTKTIVVLRITNQSNELIELQYLENGLLEEYLSAIETFDFDAFTKSAHKIYQAIIEPCEVGKNSLIMCLDGWLNNVPFEALLTSKKNWETKDYRQLDYMLMQNSIQYMLNPQFFRKEQSHRCDFRVEAYIPDNSAYSSLPFSHQLGTRLQEKFNTQVYASTHATKQNFLNSKSPIVHLSGHGVISSEDALGNYLVFSDSLLYLEDLAGLGNIPALMVLNTCNSANGKMYFGEGINGFVRAFHRLGSRSTMSNLWEVDDQASNQLLEKFYSFLNTGKSTNEALRLAQLDMLEQSKSSKMASPYYWAGHRLVGDEIIFEQRNKQSEKKVYWLLFVPVLLFGVWLWRRRLRKTHS